MRSTNLTVVLVVFLIFSPQSEGYSVLTHEAVVDTAWVDSIRPVLLRYFPDATEEDLVNAHAYAYGGAIIQDLGYYPFGNHLFTDLVHYVRSGDFVRNLLLEAEDLNEYAFALGALAHYMSDNNGHPIGVNPSVPLEYPKDRRKFGKIATYEDDPADHLKMEFAFDVLQVANGHYAPQSYRDFIGFEVAKPVLERAFLRTYGLEMKDFFLSEDLALGTYRRSVSVVIPEMTKVAWNQKKDELIKASPGLTRNRFVYNLSRASYEKEWGHDYEKPGCWARILAFLLRIIPKFGPFRALSFRPPTPATDLLFMKSFNSSVAQYRAALARLKSGKELNVPDTNLDTGKPSRFGDYQMADNAYKKLVEKLQPSGFAAAGADLRENILAYFDHAQLDSKTAMAVETLRDSAADRKMTKP